MPNIKVGPGSDPAAEMGPLITGEHRDKVKGYIDAGEKEGAKLVMDGRGKVVPGFENGFYLGTTLFDNVKTDMSIYKDELAVGELDGRITILDRAGKVIATIGQNDTAAETKSNKAPPEIWKGDKFYAVHGVAYDKKGDLLVTEFNQFGRLTKVKRE